MIKALRILLFLGLIIIDLLILRVILTYSPSLTDILSSNGFLLLLVSELVLIFPSLPLYMLITRQKINNILPLKPLGWKNAGYILLMSVLLEPVTSLLSLLTSLFFPNAALEITSMFTSNNLLAAITAVALLPALVEEICFRGVVLNASRGMNVMGAAVINGILFGLIHMNPQQIPYALFLGIIFSLYVIHTHSIFSSMLAHFLVNAPNVALALLLPGITAEAPTVDELIPPIIVLSVISSIFFLIFLSVYKRFRLYNLYRNPING